MIRWATSRPSVIWAAAAGLMIAGGVAFSKLPLATKTTVELPQISIGAAWRGASPELVEMYLTSPIEGVVVGIPGVRKTRSSSSDGSASVTVELDPGVDLALTRLAIFERLETLRANLPTQARNTLSVTNSVPEELRDKSLLLINVVGNFTPGALKKVAEDRLMPRLSALAGISEANLMGGAQVGVVLSYDPARMRQLGIDPSLLTQALGQARLVEALGDVKTGKNVLTVTLRDQPRVFEDLARIPIRASGGRVFRLGDLTRIHPEEDAQGRAFRINGRTAVAIDLQREANADAIKTAAAARKLLGELSQNLPPGIKLSIANDQSEDLAAELRDLLIRGSIAFGAVLLVLLVTLGNVRGSVLVIGSAAVAIAGAALSLYLLEVPANLLTLAGLAMGIGILVQNGLVVVERLRYVKNSAEQRAVAASRITPAVLGSTLTTSVVLFPFLYLQGNARAAFTPFATAFVLALAWSVVGALLFIPAVGRGGKDDRHWGWPRLARVNDWLVLKLLRFRYVTILLTIALLGGLTWGFIKKVPRNSWGGWGGEERETITASVSFPKGSDPQQVERLTSELESVVVGREGVALVTTTVSPQGGQVNVQFTAEGSRSDAPYVIHDALTQRAVLIGGTDNVYVSAPKGSQGYYNSSGGGSGPNKRIRILGYSYEGVLQIALDLKGRLEKIPRVRKDEININALSSWGREKSVSIAFRPDRQALGRVGATANDYVGSVSRQVYNAGSSAELEFGDEVLPVTVRSVGSRERDLSQLIDGLVSNPNGAPVRINDVSTVEEVEGLARIQREDQQYIRVLSYDFRGPQKLADRTHKAFMGSITVPPGYTVEDEVGRWGEDESSKGLTLVFGLGVVLVLLAVALVFNSVWAPAMVFLSLPMALGGVVAAFWITKSAFTREATVGVILVVGLAVHQAILLIDAVLLAKHRHGGRITAGDIVRACRDRAAIIVLVTLTTIASLVPMAWGTSATTLFGAIALATAGGTIAGTLGAMYLLPPLLLGFRKIRFRFRRKRKTPKAPSAPIEPMPEAV